MKSDLFVFYSSYYLGTVCNNYNINDYLPIDTIKISVSPGTFQGESHETFCGKTLRISFREIIIYGKVVSYCQPTDFNEYVNLSNGEIMNQRCYFNNSINFLFDEGNHFMYDTFSANIFYYDI
jgi:hypothetical protein